MTEETVDAFAVHRIYRIRDDGSRELILEDDMHGRDYALTIAADMRQNARQEFIVTEECEIRE